MVNVAGRMSPSDVATVRSGANRVVSVRGWAPRLLLPALMTLAACGASGNPGTTITGSAGMSAQGGAGTGAAAGTSGAAGATAVGTAGTTVGGAGTTAGAAGTMGASMAVCDTYCTAIMANCTATNAQYADKADCMKTCSYLPAGQPADNDGNSVGCRTNHAMAAATAAAVGGVKDVCWQAGPLGYGGCGNECDIFCPIALAYCPGSYPTLDDCHNTCSQFAHQVDFTMPGHYAADYTPGPAATASTPEAKDTLDCRAFHLFIKGLDNAAVNMAAECPNVKNVSPACGMGVVPIVVDTDGGTSGDAFMASTDGGLVTTINSTNWNETTIYPFTTRKMILRDEGDPHLALVDLSKPAGAEVVWKTQAEGAWARAAQLIGNNQILGGTSTGYQVFDITTGKITKTVTGFGNTQSAYRTVIGETMLTRNGALLTFLDKNDKMAHQISYPGYGYVRVGRPTRNGTYLIPSDTTLIEGDASGKVLWKANGAEWGHIWEALLMKSGDTLLCTAFGSSCDVVDQVTHKVTKRYGTKQMPNAAMFRPNFFSEYEILPNGNIITANWQGHGGGNGGSGIQVIEFNPAGDVVWYWKQDPAAFSSIQGVQVLDGKNPMYLHVEETSPDSTWQPVVPTP
jgi:hypothetical protein